MRKTNAELAVDVLELLVASAIVLGYGYAVLIQGERIDDPLMEALVIVAALVMFGDQYQEYFGSTKRRRAGTR